MDMDSSKRHCHQDQKGGRDRILLMVGTRSQFMRLSSEVRFRSKLKIKGEFILRLHQERCSPESAKR